jgi:hypothetical protein
MKRRINSMIQALAFIRFGQELGTDSQVSQAVAHAIDLAISIARNLLS